MRRIVRLPIAVLALAAAAPAFAFGGPEVVFAQVGWWRHVRTATVGATWDWHWQRETARGTFTGYTEVAVGRWRTTGTEDDRGYTRFGVTPVLRVYPRSIGGGWFGEIGIGANVISPMYRNGGDRFSTTFNFGDHLAVGRRFGVDGQQELAVRFEHFSNAGIRHPNPGQNLLQLRYAYRF